MESEIAEETDSEEKEEPSKPKSYRREIIIAVCSIFVAGLGTVILCLFTNLFTSTTGYVMTFWVSFLIGLGGAGVYLTLLLLVEGDLPFLRNSGAT